MDLKQAQKLILENTKYRPKSQEEVVGILNEGSSSCLKAFMSGNIKKTKDKLEDILADVLLAFEEFNIDIEEAISRRITKTSEYNQKTMHIFSDRIEIRMGEEIKGKWSIWSAEDLKDAENMAREFNCDIIWEREEQLSLFDKEKKNQ